MRTKFLLLVALTVALTKSAESDEDDGDRYNPLIRLLKQLRRRDRYRNYLNSYNREETTVAPAASNVDQLSIEPANRIANSNPNSNSYLDQDAIKKLIQDSQAQSSGSAGSSSADSTTTRRPDLIYEPIPVTKVPAQRIEQINRGVSTILGGVGGGSLEQILRGSFMFTRNDNVRNVANNVLDSIFGRRTQ